MSQKPRKSRNPSGGAQPDLDTATHGQRMGGDDPPTPRGGPNPRLPHERDESARGTGERSSEDPAPSEQRISQAGEDVKRGLVDTDRRGIPNDIPNRKTT